MEGADAATCAEVGVEGVDVELADQDVGAAGGVGSAREEGKVEDADDEVAGAMLEDGGAPWGGGQDAAGLGVVLILASPSSIFRSNPFILFERAVMVADAGSAVVEGGRAIALPNSAALGSNLGKKLVESEELAIWGEKIWGIPKNKALITNCYGPG